MGGQRVVGVMALVSCALAACASGDAPSLGAPVDTSGAGGVATGAGATTSTAMGAVADDAATAPTSAARADPDTDGDATPDPGAARGSGAAPSEPAPIETVPETGVPGLDSDDRFCAAWSRLGGTWQVLLVGSTFLDDPVEVARWEIAAAPVIAAAYRDLGEAFPAEVAEESEAALDGYFGVLARRSAAASDILAGAELDDEQLDALAERWIAALGTRSNDSPAVELELGAELEPLVDDAAAELRRRRVPIHTDPSMFVLVDTPATDAYIADNCPDQGTLAGVEVDP